MATFVWIPGSWWKIGVQIWTIQIPIQIGVESKHEWISEWMNAVLPAVLELKVAYLAAEQTGKCLLQLLD